MVLLVRSGGTRVSLTPSPEPPRKRASGDRPVRPGGRATQESGSDGPAPSPGLLPPLRYGGSAGAQPPQRPEGLRESIDEHFLDPVWYTVNVQ